METLKNKYIPMLFAGNMVEALLQDKKKQTRRALKEQPVKIDGNWSLGWMNWDIKYGKVIPAPGYSLSEKAGIKPGDIIWVRETWFSTRFDYKEQLALGNTDHIKYKADRDYDPVKDCVGRNWKPSLHMPKEACRIFLKVTSLHAERLQDISEEDAIAEGCHLYGPFGEYAGAPHPAALTAGGNAKRAYRSPVRAFQSLWEFIASEDSWNANPWVWVIKFEKIERPADFLEYELIEKA